MLECKTKVLTLIAVYYVKLLYTLFPQNCHTSFSPTGLQQWLFTSVVLEVWVPNGEKLREYIPNNKRSTQGGMSWVLTLLDLVLWLTGTGGG